MSLAWCVIALTLVGADDQRFGTPPPSGVAPVAIEGKTAEQQEPWPMDLAMATRVAFDNSENFRLIQLGVFSLNAAFFPLNTDDPIRIARLNAETPVAKLKADAMALVRSVEQEYWKLSQAQVALESTEGAVSATQELLQKVQAELTLAHCDPGVAEAAEALERLEQFLIDRQAKKADVMTAERALRKVLGLPPADHRRIIATTKPTEELLSFDWETCVDELLREQPDNVHQQDLNRLAELYLLLARRRLIPLLDNDTLCRLKGLGPSLDSSQAVLLGKFLHELAPLTSPKACAQGTDLSGNAYMDSLTWQRGLTYEPPSWLGRSPLANTRQAQYGLLRARASQRQVFDRTTHSLARCFLEVDASYKQYTAARRLRAAAALRLDVQRAYYEQGCITLDRFLDAVKQNAEAIATEARYKRAYNIALAALSEAKGTLLADRSIVVALGPRDVRPLAAAQKTPLATHIKPSSSAATVVAPQPAPDLARRPSLSMPAVPCEAATTVSDERGEGYTADRSRDRRP